MAKIENFEDLRIWQQARELSNWFYHMIKKNSELKEDWVLTKQMKSSIGSVMDNIAEGFERAGRKEFIQFLAVAKGSAGEFRSQLYRCYDAGFVNEEEFENKINSLRVLSSGINSFINYLKKSEITGWKFSESVEDYGNNN